MSKPQLLIDFGRLMLDRIDNINKDDIVLDRYIVDAIPVEWIEEWSKKFVDSRGIYRGEGYDSIWDLLEAWEEQK